MRNYYQSWQISKSMSRERKESWRKYKCGLTLAMPRRRALGRRNQHILSPGQYRQEDRDALAARATILASSLVEDGAHLRTSIAVRKAQGIRKNHSESEDSEGGHWKSKIRRKKSSVEGDDLSQPWLQRSKRSIPEKLPPTEKVHQRPHSAPQHQAKRWGVHRRLHTKVATSFLQGQEAASNKERKKVPQAWRHQEGGHRQKIKKGGGFHSQHKTEKRPDRFTLLTKTPKEILALEKGKFKTPPPMTTLVEKRNTNKFCEFHREVGHNTDECNHLRKKIEDMLKARKLSHIIRELKQSSGKEQPKKKGETSGKEKPQAILMIQSRQKVIRQKITQSFSPNPEMLFPHLRDDEGAEGPLIIEAEIGGHQVHRICVDGGSSFEILYEHCFNRLRPEIKNQMVPATTSLIGFSGEIKWPLGQITLLVKIGDDEHSTSAWMDFMVVRSTSPHNGIIGRPGLRKIQAVPSTAHGMIKFPVMGGILTLKGSKIIPVECAMVSGPEEQPILVNKVKEERVKVAINPEHPEQTVMIGSDLTEKTRSKLCNLLQRSLDIFAWTPTDMTGVPRQIAEHRLNVRKGCHPVREVHYHDWLSNPVMVKKSDNSWRMCVDFKDLNKACPKDGYPLPKIDWKVESLCGFPFKCFLDTYKGYHQIKMAEENEEKTAFITNQGIFCYTKMSFGLRNTGATYQRLVDKTFHGKIGRNLKVYVDDLVIKSRTEDEVVRDIEETFKTLRKINMKLNPKKCTFGVEEGMFLGYRDNTKCIKICPDKVDAVLILQSLKFLKDVQRLDGKLASLNRFLAKSAEKSLPFFKTLKKCTKKSDFLWTEEAEAAIRQMKEHIAKLPMLTAPEEQEELIIYLAASKEAVSVVLMTETEARQMPIYFVSRALRGPEVNYTAMEKLVLALVHASKRLRRYFQAHPIIVIIDQPIKNILSNPEVAERPEEEGQDDSIKEEELPARWTLFTDGSYCVGGCGAGVILTDPEGIAEKIGVQNLEVNVDSKLVANQVNGTYIAKETDMIKYLEKVKALASTFWAFSIKQVPRSKNKKADALSKMASTSFVHLSKQVLVEELKEKSVNEIKVLAVVEEEGDSWMTPIQEYLNNETLPEERKKARSIKRKSQRFAIINGTLYKKSFLGLWLRCVGPSQANYHFASVKHPQTNGLVERANKSLGEGIKARLGKDNKNWLEEISHVLWAHRTMIKSSNGDTPFSLTYGTEVVIPAEIGMPTFRTAELDVAKNDEALEINLELLEEKREQAAIREAKSKRQMDKYYNTKVRNTSFKPGDLVYQSNEASYVEDTGKLGPK
ncbi:reverse transcriptase domain-containing protein [Tanacetum coccineum]